MTGRTEGTEGPEGSGRKRLVLIDGHAILHRAYHALPPLTTRSGELVNAVYGFATMLFRILNELQPKYLAVAFDTSKPNFRHMEYVGYQAQRPKTDSELAGQIEKVQELVRAFDIPIFSVEGYEADDVLGTLAQQASECKVPLQGKQNSKCKVDEVLIVTGDRDLMQLVSDKVKLFMPTKGLSEGQIVGEKEVEERMGVPPEQIVDYKGLVGDQSDNYPGVSGIGPKTAAELLKEFGTLEEIYKRLGEVGNKTTVRKLAEGAESAMLSKKLATIVTDVPISLDLEECIVQNYNKEKVIGFFKELGFRSLVTRMTGGTEKKGAKSDKKTETQQSLF